MINIFRERFRRLESRLHQSGLGGVLLTPGADLHYFTGFRIGLSERPAGALIPFDAEPRWFIPELESGRLDPASWISKSDIWKDDGLANLANSLKRAGLARAKVGIAGSSPWGWIHNIERRLPQIRFEDASSEMDSLRMTKDSTELTAMRKACAIACRALKKGFRSLKTGMTELELKDVIEREMTLRGADLDFCLALFQENAALPHGCSGELKLKRGDIVLVDTGCSVSGYHSDITRTVVFGKPGPDVRRVWDTVYAAFHAAASAARPGVACRHLDRIARTTIQEAGFGSYFVHRLGHGIGLCGHEAPYLESDSESVIEPGMTFTIEPGIYLPGSLGVRLEDTFLCTKSGTESLTPFNMSISPCNA
jgi:Xaa-Pro dipeptidase